MKLNEINPYIRFARRMAHFPTGTLLCAPDYHFYYIISQNCSIEILSSIYNVKSGAIIIIPPGTKYRFLDSKQLDIISINFDYTQSYTAVKEQCPVKAQDFSREMIIEEAEFENHNFFNQPLVCENMNYLIRDIEAIINEHMYMKQFYKEISSGIFKNILNEIARYITLEKNNSEKINEILDFIHKHYSEDLNNETFAKLACYHSYHLNRLMKKSTGTSLRQYLINYRLETAKLHLRTTDLQISKISELCGYKNFSNFSSDFKKKTGLSPSEYRSQAQHLI